MDFRLKMDFTNQPFDPGPESNSPGFSGIFFKKKSIFSPFLVRKRLFKIYKFTPQ